MDGGTLPGVFWQPSSERTRRLARELAPAVIRFGGASHTSLTYNLTGKPPKPVEAPPLKPPPSTSYMNATEWDGLLAFAKAVGWRVAWGLNLALRRRCAPEAPDCNAQAGEWDPSRAQELLQYTARSPNGSVVLAWELGNERGSRSRRPSLRATSGPCRPSWAASTAQTPP